MAVVVDPPEPGFGNHRPTVAERTIMSDASSQPPGWYHAQGDPPNTQRYWDGSQWQGGPQPVAAAAPSAGVPGSYGVATGGAPAESGARFVAFLIDAGIIVVGYFAVFIAAAILGAVSDTLGGIALTLGFLGLLGLGIYNTLYLQGTTGQTIGKKQQGIKLINVETHQPVGIGMAFVRNLVQGVSWNICLIPGLIDTIFILTQPDHRRFTDKWLTMHVVKA